MKKIILILIAATSIVFSFQSCENKDRETRKEKYNKIKNYLIRWADNSVRDIKTGRIYQYKNSERFNDLNDLFTELCKTEKYIITKYEIHAFNVTCTTPIDRYDHLRVFSYENDEEVLRFIKHSNYVFYKHSIEIK